MNFFIRKKKSIINAIKGIGLIFLYLYTGYLQLFYKELLGINKPSVSQSIFLNLLSTVTFFLFLIYIYRKDLKNEFNIFKSDFENNLDIGIKYWLIGLALMLTFNILISLFLKSGVANNEQRVQEMISASPLLMILSAGFIAPIIEEILFRKCFRDTFDNNYLFVIISGVFFGYMHVSDASSISQLMYIFPYSSLGITFALMYKKSKTVFTSISMHMLHNTILTILSIII